MEWEANPDGTVQKETTYQLHHAELLFYSKGLKSCHSPTPTVLPIQEFRKNGLSDVPEEWGIVNSSDLVARLRENNVFSTPKGKYDIERLVFTTKLGPTFQDELTLKHRDWLKILNPEGKRGPESIKRLETIGSSQY